MALNKGQSLHRRTEGFTRGRWDYLSANKAIMPLRFTRLLRVKETFARRKIIKEKDLGRKKMAVDVAFKHLKIECERETRSWNRVSQASRYRKELLEENLPLDLTISTVKL